MSAPQAPQRKILIASPHTGDEEWKALAEPLKTGWLTQGPKVAEFERAFAHRHGVTHAVATSSCTSALHLILRALDIKEGDEVIVPAFTWVATANVALYCGATPVLADIDTGTFNIDPEQVAQKVTPRTRAIIAVHLFGLCADMGAVKDAASGIPIIEDAACAAGAGYKGKPAGSLGVAGAFSFHPRKVITTGEGGMITTNDPAIAAAVGVLRNHGAHIPEEERAGSATPYLLPEFNVLGYNYRMTDLQGAVGVVQLGRLDGLVSERAKWAGFYQRRLADVAWLETPHAPEGYDHGWQSFTCMVDEDKSPADRDGIMVMLADKGVATRPGTHSVHTLEYYARRFGYRPEDFPLSLSCARRSLSLPLHSRMSEDDYGYVVQTIKALAK